MSHLKRVWLPAKNLSEALQPKKYDGSDRRETFRRFFLPARARRRMTSSQAEPERILVQ
jgi:hypothetical protein